MKPFRLVRIKRTPWEAMSPNGRRQRIFRMKRSWKRMVKLAGLTPFKSEAVKKASETLLRYQTVGLA